MKTAVSIPDPVFERADRLAGRLGKSRSQLYAEALVEYLDRHSPDEVTGALDRVCDQLGEGVDPAIQASARQALERTEW